MKTVLVVMSVKVTVILVIVLVIVIVIVGIPTSLEIQTRGGKRYSSGLVMYPSEV